MGGFNSQAFLGCEELADGSRRSAVMVFLPDEVVDKPDIFEQLLAETEVAARIDHKNVMSVFGLAKIDDGFARIVEYAAAESLAVTLRHAREKEVTIPVPVALKIVADACMGVHYAHELGATESGTPLIHGAVRPGTLLIGYAGRTKVSGYGAAILAEGLARSRGAAFGQADPYTAPEQLLGGRNAATAQTDVYALGAVLFELLLDRPPAASDSAVFETILKQQLNAPDVAARVAGGLTDVVHRAMRKRAVERYKTPFDMMEALLKQPMASEEEVSAFMEGLFGKEFPARRARDQLMENFETAPAVESEVLAPTGDYEPPPSAYRSSANLLQVISSIPQPADEPTGETTPEPVKPEPAQAKEPTAETVPETPAPKPAPTPAPAQPPPTPAPAPAPTYVAPPQQRVEYRTPTWLLVVVGMLVMGAAFGAFLAFKGDPPPPPPPPVATPTPTPTPDPVPEPKPDPAPDPEPVEPPPPTEGRLVINSSPPMDLYVNGKKVGNGKVTLTKKPGTYKVKGKNSKERLSRSKTVTVKAGKTAKASFIVRKGKLNVATPPGCTVYIDGRKVSSFPVSLYQGRHKVVVKKAGFEDYRHSVTIRPGLEGTLTVRFGG
jgi:serine/threonine-protein kinase